MYIISKSKIFKEKFKYVFNQCLKFIYSEKATKFCEISTLLLTETTQDKYMVEILQNFVAFSEYMNLYITPFKSFDFQS